MINDSSIAQGCRFLEGLWWARVFEIPSVLNEDAFWFKWYFLSGFWGLNKAVEILETYPPLNCLENRLSGSLKRL